MTITLTLTSIRSDRTDLHAHRISGQIWNIPPVRRRLTMWQALGLVQLADALDDPVDRYPEDHRIWTDLAEALRPTGLTTRDAVELLTLRYPMEQIPHVPGLSCQRGGTPAPKTRRSWIRNLMGRGWRQCPQR